MGQETMAKKEKEKKKQKRKQEKEQKKRERQANNDKGKSLEDMMVYLDENGNLSDTPPDPKKKKEISPDEIQLDAAWREGGVDAGLEQKGIVKFFNTEKGYGFIDDKNGNSLFVHINQLTEEIKQGDKVIFESERGPKGLSAVNVRKVV